MVFGPLGYMYIFILILVGGFNPIETYWVISPGRGKNNVWNHHLIFKYIHFGPRCPPHTPLRKRPSNKSFELLQLELQHVLRCSILITSGPFGCFRQRFLLMFFDSKKHILVSWKMMINDYVNPSKPKECWVSTCLSRNKNPLLQFLAKWHSLW